MTVTVRYLAQLRQTLDIESEVIELPDPVGMATLLDHLVERHGPQLGRFVFDEDHNIRRSVLMMVNGTAVDPGGDDALSDGDEFTILPAMAGGSDEIKRGACAG